MNLNPTATAQATKSPLPVAPSTDQTYILPAAQSQHKEAPTTKATSIALPVLQKFKKLVATVRAFATTSKIQAAAYIAWHSGWFGCRSDLEHLNPTFLSSASSNSLQRPKEVVWGEHSLPHFLCLIFRVLFYFILF